MALTFASSAALAQEVITPVAPLKRSPLYVTLDAGYGKVSEQFEGLPRASDGFEAELAIGYNVSDGLGIEVGYQSYANQKFGTTVEGSQNHTYFVGVRGTNDLNEKLKVYGRAGLAFAHHRLVGTNVDTDTSRATLMLGAGLSLALTEGLDLNLIDLHGTLKNGPIPAMYAVGVGLTWTPAFR